MNDRARPCDFEVRPGTPADREAIYAMRHDVYAVELRQHAEREDRRLEDDLDDDNVYVVAARRGEIVAFVSVTPPSRGKYSIDKYWRREDVPIAFDDGLYEIRILTVREDVRAGGLASLLMWGAFRHIESSGGRRIVAIGRRDLLGLYRRVGMRPIGETVRAGEVAFELMTATVESVRRRSERYHHGTLDRLRKRVRWSLDIPFFEDAAEPGASAAPGERCIHGGRLFDALGGRLTRLDDRDAWVDADVLDAWFPPAPAVGEALERDATWLAATSPPAFPDDLVGAIARARGVPAASIAPGAGSSDLIFRAFRRWLGPRSRVLLPEPTYGEYAHVAERVVGCHVDTMPLAREEGFAIDVDRLIDRVRSRRYDLVVLVNPNNPTGGLLDPRAVTKIVDELPPGTRLWIDEAYVDYVAPGASMERFAARHEHVTVCKSMSKVYALSGARVAYAVTAPETARALTEWLPPWGLSLPAQVAAVHALADPDYYRARYDETRRLRRRLARDLAAIGLEPVASCANFIVVRLPEGAGDAPSCVARCRERRVLVRDLSNLSDAFGGRVVRVAVKDNERNERIVRALESALHDARARRFRGVGARRSRPGRRGANPGNV